jgi:oligopeptide/dipeptide ABC transporter ATP-binding protein
VGPAESVLFSPQHPYAQALLRCLPLRWGDGFAKRKKNLPVISGEAPSSVLDAGGCPFEPRCPERMDACRMRGPEMVRLRTAHEASCFKLAG